MGWLDEILGGYSGPHVVFNGTRFTPEKFGMTAVPLSADSSRGVVESLVRLGRVRPRDDSVFSRAAKNLQVVQMQVFAMHVATYHTRLILTPGCSLALLQQFKLGADRTIQNGPFGPAAAEVIIALIQYYGKLLTDEVQSAQESTLDGSPTAEAVCKYICKGLGELSSYSTSQPLVVDDLDRTAITMLMQASRNAQFASFKKLGLQIAPT